MITEFFPNPNKPKSHFQSPASTMPAPNYGQIMANGFGRSYNEYWAKKKGCTVEEFVERDNAYKRQAARATYAINAVMYPYSWEEYQKKGKVRILKIDRSYAHSDLEWKDKEPLYLVEAVTTDNQYHVFRATVGFFQTTPPEEPKDEPKKDGE